MDLSFKIFSFSDQFRLGCFNPKNDLIVTAQFLKSDNFSIEVKYSF